MSNDSEFHKFLKSVSEDVKKWPDWKQNASIRYPSLDTECSIHSRIYGQCGVTPKEVGMDAKELAEFKAWKAKKADAAKKTGAWFLTEEGREYVRETWPDPNDQDLVPTLLRALEKLEAQVGGMSSPDIQDVNFYWLGDDGREKIRDIWDTGDNTGPQIPLLDALEEAERECLVLKSERNRFEAMLKEHVKLTQPKLKRLQTLEKIFGDEMASSSMGLKSVLRGQHKIPDLDLTEEMTLLNATEIMINQSLRLKKSAREAQRRAQSDGRAQDDGPNYEDHDSDF